MLPAWTTPAELAQWMGLPSSAASDPVLGQVLEVAQGYQEAHLDPTMLATAAAVPDADLVTATHMRASALYKRRQTPDGISSVGDFAVMRVATTDPDVRRLESRLWLDGFA
jgi:hypothetical protein